MFGVSNIAVAVAVRKRQIYKGMHVKRQCSVCEIIKLHQILMYCYRHIEIVHLYLVE